MGRRTGRLPAAAVGVRMKQHLDVIRAMVKAGATGEVVLVYLEHVLEASEPTFVYGLCDPRGQHIFYIGITRNLKDRLNAHRRDRSSAAYQRVAEIEAAGYECEMNVFRECRTRDEAIEHEAQLISSLPDLVNRDRPKPRSIGRELQ